jgi:hypothetical protein
MLGDRVETVAVSGFYKISRSAYFISEGQIAQPLAVFNSKLGNACYDALLPVEEKEKLGIFDVKFL